MLSDMTRLPLLGGGRKPWNIIIIIFYNERQFKIFHGK